MLEEDEKLMINELNNANFISYDIDKSSLLTKLKKLTIHVSTLKSFSNMDEKEGVKLILQKIPKIKIFLNGELERDYQSISNTICLFVDFMKLLAPRIELEESVLIFYFRLSVGWLQNFALNIFDIPSNFQLKFDYLLDRLAKTNLLSLMINVGIEEEIRTVIDSLINIQGDKRYTLKSDNFNNIVSIIKGLFEEVRSLSIPLLNDLLISLIRKEMNKDKFNLSFQIMTEMKNILSAPLNQLIISLIKNDNHKTEIQEIQNINGAEFVCLIRTLCKISQEYLINFLSTLNADEPLKKAKIKGATLLDIFIGIFSSKNSVYIARDYPKFFYCFLDSLKSKTFKEIEKLNIFKSLMKFLYSNNKKEAKSHNLYSIVIERIKSFFQEIRSEEIGILLLDYITHKTTSKKISFKIIACAQIFLDCKISKLNLATIDFNITLLLNQIFKTTSLYDFFSKDKMAKVAKYSVLLNNIIKLYDASSQYFKDKFNNKIFDILNVNKNKENSDKSRLLLILFSLSSWDFKSYSFLHRFFLESLDISCVILKHCLLKETNSYLMTENQFNSDRKIKQVNLSKFSKNLENSKIKLEKESNFILKLDELTNNKTNSDLFVKIFTQFAEEDLPSEVTKSLPIDDENRVIFNRAMMILLSHTQIRSIIDFGNMLLNTFDMNENQTNLRGITILQNILSVIFYYTKHNLNSFIILEEEGKHFDTSILKEIFLEIVNYIKNILILKISTKDTLNYIAAIIKLIFEFNNSSLSEYIESAILNELSKICFESYEVSAKYLAVLYLELNKIRQEQNYFPLNFESYLYDSVKKLGPIKFLNELIKYQSKSSIINNLIFNKEMSEYILNYCSSYYDNLQKETISEIKINKNLTLKNKLVEIICTKHEILKYEFNNILYINESEEVSLNHKQRLNNYTKKILNIIYVDCNYNEDIEASIYNDENMPTQEEKKITKLIRQCNNIEICKMINLIFKLFENGNSIKPNHQVKLMNVALYNEVIVRDHLLKKLEKCLLKNETIYYQLHALPIISVYFNDPDKEIRKKALNLFSVFVNYLVKKYNSYTNYDKLQTKNVIYKYTPEVYVSYVITYFVFNSNLNLLYQSKELKYFETIFINFMKILKKNTAGNFDSNFVIQLLLKLKSSSLEGKRVMKKISHETYIKNLIKKESYLVTDSDYEKTKNDLCNIFIKIINMNFSSSFRYQDTKPNIPLIFLSEKEFSLINSNIKTERKNQKESEFDFDLSKLENKLENQVLLNDMSVLMAKSCTSNQAVMDYKLKLEPTSKSKTAKEEYDEFEDLPYYNKYKNKNHKLSIESIDSVSKISLNEYSHASKEIEKSADEDNLKSSASLKRRKKIQKENINLKGKKKKGNKY